MTCFSTRPFSTVFLTVQFDLRGTLVVIVESTQETRTIGVLEVWKFSEVDRMVDVPG